MRFNKKSKSIDEQIELLRSRGMLINDLEAAKHYLSHLNYYRLAGYWLPFEEDRTTHKFRNGTNFESVLNLYVFDRELRLIVLDAIERIEVSLRTKWAYYFAQDYGSHGFMNYSLFRNQELWMKDMDNLRREIDRSKEDFIKHYLDTYTNPDLPPIWAICEVMSFGLLSRFYDNLKPMKIRKEIASVYELDNKVLASLIHHLNEVRNFCAHHSRLWNRRFTITLKLPRTPSILASFLNPSAERQLYNTLVMLIWLLNRVSPAHCWHTGLLDLIKRHQIQVRSMGFPDRYDKLSIWREF